MMAGESTQGLSNVQRAVVKAFSRSLNRETLVLTQHPDLLWQQFYILLQMEKILAPKLVECSISMILRYAYEGRTIQFYAE